MIVDIHSHAWDFPAHFSERFLQQAARARAGVEVDLSVGLAAYESQCVAGTKTVVFGGKAKLGGIWVDDQYVADYVAQSPDSLIGFLSVDPTQDH